MKIQSVTCASCGAVIQLPADTDRLKCDYCGATLVVEGDEERVTTAPQSGSCLSRLGARLIVGFIVYGLIVFCVSVAGVALDDLLLNISPESSKPGPFTSTAVSLSCIAIAAGFIGFLFLAFSNSSLANAIRKAFGKSKD